MSEDPTELELHLVPTTTHGRVLVRPAPAAGAAGWFVGFHGYGQSAAGFVEPLTSVPGAERWLVASVQGLHRFYARSTDTVVASWMTREDRESAIADNIAYADGVLDALERTHGTPRRLVFAGFSQGVAMALRAGVRGRRSCDAIVVSGGDVPPELFEGTVARWPRTLLATGSQDAFYTPARLAGDARGLRDRGCDVRALVFPGGHDWTPELRAAAGEELARLR